MGVICPSAFPLPLTYPKRPAYSVIWVLFFSLNNILEIVQKNIHNATYDPLNSENDYVWSKAIFNMILERFIKTHSGNGWLVNLRIMYVKGQRRPTNVLRDSQFSIFITLFMISFDGLFTFRRSESHCLENLFTMRLETKSKQMIFSYAR